MGVLVILTANAGYLSLYYHIFGTDQVGQDVFYKSLKSIRTGLVIGTLTTLVMLPFAALFGIMAGYFRGWVDDVIQYVYTTPELDSRRAADCVCHPEFAGIYRDPSRIVHQRHRARGYPAAVPVSDTRRHQLDQSGAACCAAKRSSCARWITSRAARALGASHTAVMARHILPNVMHIILITVVLDFSGLVLAEAVLSYVGVGVDPTMDSWGNMIVSARLEMARDPLVWWSLASAFVFMFGLVLAANLFSDAVRDAFDPRLRK